MSGSGTLPIDDGTARAINSGRESLGVVLRSAQRRLQVVFIAFVVGMLPTIVAMRAWIWPQLKEDLLAKGATVIAQTPFDVILLQVKIGLGVGIVVALPVLLYEAREPLRQRDLIPTIPFSRAQFAVIGGIALALAVLGVTYAYVFFFPLLFAFLVDNAQSAGLVARYSIVHWTQFIIALSAAFAAAAELPLAMTSLSYAGIVSPRTWHNYRRHAILGIVVVGTAINGSPEPFSAMLVALPMIVLYMIGIYVSRLAGRVSSDAAYEAERVPLRIGLRARWQTLVALVLAGAGAGYGIASFTALDATLGTSLGLPPTTAQWVLVAAGFVVAAVLGVLGVALFAQREPTVSTAGSGSPHALDLDTLDAAGVRAAPPEAFASMGEDEALAAAETALAMDDHEKAQAILDRFDESHAAQEEPEAEEAAATEAAAGDEEAGESDTITRTTTGIVDAFTEDETTEDDIGGYFYDIAFIFNSLRSRLFHVTAVFMGVIALSFAVLYRGGLEYVKEDFLSRLPEAVKPAEMAIITLHPVEALVFMMKLSLLFGVVAVVPVLLYYAWPALADRGLIRGNRRAVYLWGGSIVGALVVGSVIGYAYVAPPIISYLVADAARAGMVISYRVNNFLWMVFLLTVGIGLLAEVPITMWLAHFTGVVGYGTMRRRWRVPVIGSFALGAVVTPESLYTMLIIAVPLALAYVFGVAVLAVLSVDGRFGGPKPASRSEAA